MHDNFLLAMPNECCGLLAGRVSADGAIGQVSAHYPLMNDLCSPTEFLSNADDMLAAVKDMRKKGIDILAVYHSHPDSEPIPSKRDLERNYSPTVINVIIGFTNDEVDMRAWWLDETAFAPAEFEVG